MSKHPVSLTKSESISGFGYLMFQIVFLPGLLMTVLSCLPFQVDMSQMNFLYYGVNLLAILVIFRKFLLKNLDAAMDAPGQLTMAVLFGMGRYILMTSLLGILLYEIDPVFINANDSAISDLAGENLTLMALGTIVLVPPVEECLFRGLIFRNLLDKYPKMAYLVSTVAFAAIHLMSYLTVYSPKHLLLAFLQYVPAGICLGWAYRRSGTIFAPILIHSLVNAMGIAAMR